MARKYGLNSYTVQEGVNSQLGQAGFKELTDVGDTTGDGNFIAFYVSGGNVSNEADVSATTHVGDNMTQAKFLANSIVYGPFKKITLEAATDGDVHVLCYYG